MRLYEATYRHNGRKLTLTRHENGQDGLDWVSCRVESRFATILALVKYRPLAPGKLLECYEHDRARWEVADQLYTALYGIPVAPGSTASSSFYDALAAFDER